MANPFLHILQTRSSSRGNVDFYGIIRPAARYTGRTPGGGQGSSWLVGPEARQGVRMWAARKECLAKPPGQYAGVGTGIEEFLTGKNFDGRRKL